MDFAALTRTRRTVGAFTADRVDDGVVDEALELSLWAPNHRLTFPMRFVKLGPTTRSGLAGLAIDLKAGKAPLGDPQRTAIRDAVTKSSHLIALGLARSADPVVAHEDYATLACAVQIATTHLWQKGIATKWSTAGWTTSARTYKILGLDPSRVKLEGCLMIGHAAATPNAPKRPSLASVTTSTV